MNNNYCKATFLLHSSKGTSWEKKDHKYIRKYKNKNGKWIYVYDINGKELDIKLKQQNGLHASSNKIDDLVDGYAQYLSEKDLNGKYLVDGETRDVTLATTKYINKYKAFNTDRNNYDENALAITTYSKNGEGRDKTWKELSEISKDSRGYYVGGLGNRFDAQPVTYNDFEKHNKHKNHGGTGNSR